MNSLKRSRAIEILNNAKNKKVAVIGDVMLDRFFWGSVSRISPEAPVPVIDVEEESFHLGGAANVAKNLSSLGLIPVLFGILGDDNSGKIFYEIATSNGIIADGLYMDKNRPTTVKTRIIGNNQHIARIDREVRDKISLDAEDFILTKLKDIKDLAAIILEDYNKGLLTESLINSIIIFSLDNNIPVFVDPKSENFFSYRKCTLFKPNRKEAANALRMNLKTKDDIITAGKKLLEKIECKNVLITLGSEGMYLFEDNGNIYSVPTFARKVADVSGAGDTTIATLCAGWVGGASVKDASALANYAAGLVVEKPGIVSVDINELIEKIKE